MKSSDNRLCRNVMVPLSDAERSRPDEVFPSESSVSGAFCWGTGWGADLGQSICPCDIHQISRRLRLSQGRLVAQGNSEASPGGHWPGKESVQALQPFRPQKCRPPGQVHVGKPQHPLRSQTSMEGLISFSPGINQERRARMGTC